MTYLAGSDTIKKHCSWCWPDNTVNLCNLNIMHCRIYMHGAVHVETTKIVKYLLREIPIIIMSYVGLDITTYIHVLDSFH